MDRPEDARPLQQGGKSKDFTPTNRETLQKTQLQRSHGTVKVGRSVLEDILAVYVKVKSTHVSSEPVIPLSVPKDRLTDVW